MVELRLMPGRGEDAERNDMTEQEQQITDRLAVEVMEWHLVIRVWYSWDGSIQVFEQNQRDFDPLHDRNHAALPRKKMREMGYSFSRDDVTNRDGSLFFEGPHEVTIGKTGMFVCSVADKDERKAEMLAILAAVDKEKENAKD